jgi:hypothetical protein
MTAIINRVVPLRVPNTHLSSQNEGTFHIRSRNAPSSYYSHFSTTFLSKSTEKFHMVMHLPLFA